MVTSNKRWVGNELVDLIASHHLVLDGTDNFLSRHEINRACHAAKVPLLSAAVTQFSGQLSLFDYAPDSPCYACLYQRAGEDQNNCIENGVLGPTASIVASMQALEACKYLSGMRPSVLHTLLTLDLKQLVWHKARIRHDPACAICVV